MDGEGLKFYEGLTQTILKPMNLHTLASQRVGEVSPKGAIERGSVRITHGVNVRFWHSHQ